jgi:asparagine synthase (glutamine-hydrolysing)
MCGIAGIFNPNQQLHPEARDLCTRMTRAMQYRGPDEDGIHSDTHAVLGHRRLSIIDLSTGQQPMRAARGSCVLVFNGEIYNFQELRAQLAAEGYPFSTKSDTEVILAGYEKWGCAVVEKLRGMFAFAVYDPGRKCLFAARDPIGKKPFYYTITPDGDFYFASDMQGLAASEVLDGRLSSEAIGLYLNLGYIPAPHAVYRDAQKLKAGHALIYDPQGLRLWQYWDINLESMDSERESIHLRRLGELLDQAVKSRLVAEVPLGALLSGGIDSNLVVAAMSKITEEPVKTYTAGFNQKAQLGGTRDERKLAASAARFYGTNHEEIPVEYNLGEIAPALASYLGEPFADSSSIPTYLVCRAARKKVTVALTGDGGDEPFGGYSFRYIPHLLEEKIRRSMPRPLLHPLAHFLAPIWPTSPSLPRYLRLSTIFRNLSTSPLESFFMDQAICNGASPHLSGEFRNGRALALQLVSDLYNKASKRDELTRMLYVDAKLYMAEDVLVKADRMSMANSLELRSPLLDQDIISYAFALPSERKINQSRTKYLLRALAKDRVAPEIVNQPKTGFSIPIEQYLRTQYKDTFEERILRPDSEIKHMMDLPHLHTIWQDFLTGENRNVPFLWAIFAFSLWLTEFHARQHFRQ